jgi:nitrite reductase/ring-hydroxylating ferredoxin subunit/DMSO/TMAO reductase YedYZ heme-binding membrane subunit
MSASYKTVLWNRQKSIYDFTLIAFVFSYLALFMIVTVLFNPDVTQETLIIRSTATLAVIMLHVILMIGPLCRLNPVFLPLLYNRRHLGVTMFCVAATHGVFAILQFHTLGNINPILSVFLSNTHYPSMIRFPFQVLGFFALIIFFLMAITSHDFWLHNLGPRFWKTLHMMVYVAYSLILFHVMLGVIQYETSPVLPLLLGVGLVTIIILHILSAMKEGKADIPLHRPAGDGFIRICKLNEILNNRAKVVCLSEERIAIFRYENKLSAVSNVCKHQNGPLGEGRIVEGCITCPWHGYQYLPHNGSSPPPFREMVATYDVKLIDNEVWVNPTPYPDGTERPPAIIPD